MVLVVARRWGGGGGGEGEGGEGGGLIVAHLVVHVNRANLVIHVRWQRPARSMVVILNTGACVSLP